MLTCKLVPSCVLVGSVECSPKDEGSEQWTLHGYFINYDQIDCKFNEVSRVASSMSGSKYLSTRGGSIVFFTFCRIASNFSEDFNSNSFAAVKAISNSMPNMWEILWRSISHFLAANPPIETWSSWPAEVTIESTEAGLTKTLLSESRAALVSEIIWWLTLDNHHPAVQPSIFDQIRGQSWHLSVDVLLSPCITELTKFEKSKSQEIWSLSHIFPMKITSWHKFVLLNSVLFVVHQRIISSTIHFFLNHPDSHFKRFDNSSQSFRKIQDRMNFLLGSSLFMHFWSLITY